MTIEQAVRDRLLDISALTALVSTRIYQLKQPQGGSLPSVVLQLISTVDVYHARGPVRFHISRVQIVAYDKESSGYDPYASASNIASVIHGDALGVNASGLAGWIGDTGGSPAQIHIAFARVIAGPMPFYESEELREVGIRQDFEVHWWEL